MKIVVGVLCLLLWSANAGATSPTIVDGSYQDCSNVGSAKVTTCVDFSAFVGGRKAFVYFDFTDDNSVSSDNIQQVWEFYDCTSTTFTACTGAKPSGCTLMRAITTDVPAANRDQVGFVLYDSSSSSVGQYCLYHLSGSTHNVEDAHVMALEFD